MTNLEKLMKAYKLTEAYGLNHTINLNISMSIGKYGMRTHYSIYLDDESCFFKSWDIDEVINKLEEIGSIQTKNKISALILDLKHE